MGVLLGRCRALVVCPPVSMLWHRLASKQHVKQGGILAKTGAQAGRRHSGVASEVPPWTVLAQSLMLGVRKLGTVKLCHEGLV